MSTKKMLNGKTFTMYKALIWTDVKCVQYLCNIYSVLCKQDQITLSNWNILFQVSACSGQDKDKDKHKMQQLVQDMSHLKIK